MAKKQPAKEKKKLLKKKPVVIDVIEQALFTSVGLVLKTRHEVRELAKDFVKKAELSENEGKKFIDDVLNQYGKSRKKLEEKVESRVKDIVRRTSLVTRDEFEEIKNDIKKLQKTSAK